MHRKYLPALLFFSFLVWIIYLANTGQSSIFFDFVHWLPMGDKIGHAGLFGMLTVLTNLALGNRRVGRFPLGALLVIGFVLVEEVSQYFLPNRTFDIVDLFADGIGIFMGAYSSSRLRPFALNGDEIRGVG